MAAAPGGVVCDGLEVLWTVNDSRGHRDGQGLGDCLALGPRTRLHGSTRVYDEKASFNQARVDEGIDGSLVDGAQFLVWHTVFLNLRPDLALDQALGQSTSQLGIEPVGPEGVVVMSPFG